MIAAMEKGGHPRTGFETSLHHEDGRLAGDNLDKVHRLKQVTAKSGLTFAPPPQQAREWQEIH